MTDLLVAIGAGLAVLASFVAGRRSGHSEDAFGGVELPEDLSGNLHRHGAITHAHPPEIG